MAKFDYKTATTEEIFSHYYGASRQVIYQTKKDYEDNPEVHTKLSRAAIMVKIAKLEQEIACLRDELEALESHQETHTQNAESQHPCGFQEV